MDYYWGCYIYCYCHTRFCNIFNSFYKIFIDKRSTKSEKKSSNQIEECNLNFFSKERSKLNENHDSDTYVMVDNYKSNDSNDRIKNQSSISHVGMKINTNLPIQNISEIYPAVDRSTNKKLMLRDGNSDDYIHKYAELEKEHQEIHVPSASVDKKLMLLNGQPYDHDKQHEYSVLEKEDQETHVSVDSELYAVIGECSCVNRVASNHVLGCSKSSNLCHTIGKKPVLDSIEPLNGQIISEVYANVDKKMKKNTAPHQAYGSPNVSNVYAVVDKGKKKL